ncbi:hypothetical protein CR513_13438, partial [Mucuna pruriens]
MIMLTKLTCSIGRIPSTKFEVKNSLQEGEDDAYMGNHIQDGENDVAAPTLEGPMTRGRLERIQEKCTQSWPTSHHYMLPNEFVVHNDHKLLKYLKCQHKLNKRQPKWVEFVENFPYVIKYKQGKENVVVDSLSRRHAPLAMMETKFVRKSLMRELLVKDAYEGGLMGHFGI